MRGVDLRVIGTPSSHSRYVNRLRCSSAVPLLCGALSRKSVQVVVGPSRHCRRRIDGHRKTALLAAFSQYGRADYQPYPTERSVFDSDRRRFVTIILTKIITTIVF